MLHLILHIKTGTLSLRYVAVVAENISLMLISNVSGTGVSVSQLRSIAPLFSSKIFYMFLC